MMPTTRVFAEMVIAIAMAIVRVIVDGPRCRRRVAVAVAVKVEQSRRANQIAGNHGAV